MKLGLLASRPAAGVAGAIAIAALAWLWGGAAGAAPADCRLPRPITTENLNAAIARCAATGGGTVSLPEGIHVLGTVFVKPGVRFKGVARGQTVIQSTGEHGINAESGLANAHISDLTVDGTQLLAGHCIRLSHSTRDVIVERFEVFGCPGYGVGLQNKEGTPGFKRVTIRDGFIRDVGMDGLDIKDYSRDNESLVIDGVTVENPGISSSGKAAFDIRGPVTASNLHVRRLDRVDGYQVGIRVRWGPATVSNFQVAGSGPNARGIVVEEGHAVFTNGILLTAVKKLIVPPSVVSDGMDMLLASLYVY
jgi:hypothetical protein